MHEAFHDPVHAQQRRESDWHRDIAGFIAALDGDPDLKDRISYRCLKLRDAPDYIHLAAADEQAVKTLQGKEFFKRYTEKTREISGGAVTVTPIEIIAETTYRS